MLLGLLFLLLSVFAAPSAWGQGVTTYPGVYPTCIPITSPAATPLGGATCDGSTDNTAIFQAANQQGGCYTLPSSTSVGACLTHYFNLGQATQPPTEVSTDISVAPGNPTVYTSAGAVNFLTDNYQANELANVSGAVHAGNNGGPFLITAVGAHTLSVVNLNAVTESAGNSITISSGAVPTTWKGAGETQSILEITQPNDSPCSNSRTTGVTTGGSLLATNVFDTHMEDMTIEDTATYSTTPATQTDSADTGMSVASGSPAVYTSTTFGFSLNGYVVGDHLVASGFSNSGNNGTFPITAVGTHSVSVTNNSAVNEAAGQPVTMRDQESNGLQQTCFVNMGSQGNGNPNGTARLSFDHVRLEITHNSGIYTPRAMNIQSGVAGFSWNYGGIGTGTSGNGGGIYINQNANNTRLTNLDFWPSYGSGYNGDGAGGYNFDSEPAIWDNEPSGGDGPTLIQQNLFHNRPNDVLLTGAGEQAMVSSNYPAWPSSPTILPWWLPSIAVTAGEYILENSTQGTVTCSSNTSITSSSINTNTMWVFEPLTIFCGTASAAVNTWITAISSSTAFTVGTAMSVSGASKTVNIPAGYDGEVVKVTTSGTTNSTPPTWPTTTDRQLTVTDGTATLTSYGYGAFVADQSTQAVSVLSNDMLQVLLATVCDGCTGLNVFNNHIGTAWLDGWVGSSAQAVAKSLVPVDVVYRNNTLAAPSGNTYIAGIQTEGTASRLSLLRNSGTRGSGRREDMYSLGSGTSGDYLQQDVSAAGGLGLSSWTNDALLLLEAPFHLDAGTSTFGLSTSFPTATVIAQSVAPIAGHFTRLSCSSVLFGTCTTAPIVNVFDGTSNTGTQLQCPNSATETKGTGTSSAQTQTFAAGDVIGIYVVTQGGTCTADEFTVSADAETP